MIEEKKKPKQSSQIIIYGFPFDPKRPVTQKPPYYVATVNGIIVKKERDGNKIIQWAINHVNDKSFNLTHNALRSTLLSWDGTDNHGNRLPAGVYFVRIQSSEGEQSVSVVLLR